MSRILSHQTACFQGPVALYREQGVVVVTLLEPRLIFDVHIDPMGEALRRVTARQEVRRVAIDLARVTGMGNGVVGHLIRTWRDLHRRGGHMALCNLLLPIREIMQLTRLDRIFHLADTLDQGIAWLVAAPPASPRMADPTA